MSMSDTLFLKKRVKIFCCTKVIFIDMDIAHLAIHGVVCQKSDFHGNSDIQNSQKLDPLEITAKKISGQNMLAFQRYFVARNRPMVHYKK
jgi:hypothetical protein